MNPSTDVTASDLTAREDGGDGVTRDLASDVADGSTMIRKSQRNRYKAKWLRDYIIAN